MRRSTLVKSLLSLSACAGLCWAVQGIAVASRPAAIITEAEGSEAQIQPTDPGTPPAQPERQRGRKGGGGGGGGGKEQPPRGDNLMSRMTGFLTDVPAQDHSVVLVQAQPTSMGISVVVNSDRQGQVVYSRVDAAAMHKTELRPLKAGVGELFTLSGLSAGTTYNYRFVWNTDGKQERGEPGTFTTPGGNVDSVRFTVIADSHLDTNMDPKVYAVALKNAAADKPAFHIDLGDTFMTDKRRDFHEAAAQYDAQRYYLSTLCDQVPLYMVLGNHDGEAGSAITGRDGGEPMAPWSYAMRTSRFPPPNIGAGSMYTGRTALEGTKGSHYYAFEWPTNFGNVQIIALDPFWMTTQRPRGGGGSNGNGGGGSGPGNTNTDQNWTKTLGREQFDWLEKTLESSKAPYRFVFIHHLVGGFGKDSRGGMESSVFFEWGGQNADGSPGFATKREGWSMPIHDLLVKHGVSAVFHGHDHLYVRAERDGLIYQCVPQPGNSQGGTRSSADYGYKSGTVLGSPGHLRVTIDKAAAKVEFVRSSLGEQAPDRRREKEPNGAVIHSYEIKPHAHSSGR